MDAGFWSGLFSAVGKVATTKIPMIGEGAGQMNGTTEAVFDNSGWNVAFDGSSVTSSAQKTIDQTAAATGTPQAALPYGANGAGVALSDSTLIYGAMFAVILLIIRKKKA